MNKDSVPISITTTGQSSENELLRDMFSSYASHSTTTPGKKEDVPLSSRDYSGLMDMLMQGHNPKSAKQMSIAGGESLQLLNAINNIQPTHSGSMGSVSNGMPHVGNSFSSKNGVNLDGLWLEMKKGVEEGKQPLMSALRGKVDTAVQQPPVSSLRNEMETIMNHPFQRETDKAVQQPSISALRRDMPNPMVQPQMNSIVSNPMQQPLLSSLQRERAMQSQLHSNSPLQSHLNSPLQSHLNSPSQSHPSISFDAHEHVHPLRPRFRNSLQPRFSNAHLWGSQPSARNGDLFRGKSYDLCVALSFPPSLNRNETDVKRSLEGIKALGPAVLPILLDTGDLILPCSHEILCGTKLPVNRHGVLYMRRMMTQIEAILTQYQITCPFLSIANPGVFFGVELLDVLKLVRKLVRGGYVSEQIVLVGRDVDVQNPPDFDQYASSMKRLYETTPFNSPFSMVETPSR